MFSTDESRTLFDFRFSQELQANPDGHVEKRGAGRVGPVIVRRRANRPTRHRRQGHQAECSSGPMAASGQPAPHVDYEGAALGLTRPILLNFPVGTRCAIGTGATGGCGAVVAAQGVARTAGTATGASAPASGWVIIPPKAPHLPLDLFGLPDQVSIRGKWLILRGEEIMETNNSYFPPRLENIRSRISSSEPTPRIFRYLGALPSLESAQPE
jgi:hypothetical protein